jgi:hypothetical protein
MKRQLNEVKKFQKIAGLIKEDYDETNLDTIMHDIQSSLETSSALKTDFKLHALDIMSNIEAAMYEEDYDDVLTGFEELQDEIKSNNSMEYEQVYMEMLEKAIRRAEALSIESEDDDDDEDGYGPYIKEDDDHYGPVADWGERKKDNYYDSKDAEDDGSGDPDYYGPVSDWGEKRRDADAAHFGIKNNGLEEDSVRMWKSDNPEGDRMVLGFLKKIAKLHDYPVAQAAIFVKERLKKLGF